MTRRDTLALAPAAALAQRPAGSSNLCFESATQLARLLRRREVSAVEVLDAHLQQIARVNPKVNAIVTLVAEQARDAAKHADALAAKGQFLGPLHGLPVAHKDLVDTKGIRTTYGSPLYRDHVPAEDALIVKRMRRAGAITIGKTNTPEFGAGSQTFNPVFGATRNPWNLDKTPGGSSGGAAAALACGMIPLADGSDMGGSLRNPAAFCGVVGFRVSPGRVPGGPTWNPLAVSGPMARNVADVALLLSVLAGPDAHSPLSIPESGDRFARPLDRSFRNVRVAFKPDFAGLPYDPSISTAIGNTRKVFESLGCALEAAEPDLRDADRIFKTFRALGYHERYAGLLRSNRDSLKDTIVEEIERGAKLTGPEIAEAQELWSKLLSRAGDFFEKREFLVLPVTQVPPFDVTEPYVKQIGSEKFTSYIDWMRSCWYVTLMGLPAISVPAGFTPDGLPVGVQIVGRRHDDWGVLQLAAAFERANPVRGVPPAAR